MHVIDNTLSDFIINLIQVDKSAQEVNHELLSCKDLEVLFRF